MSKTKQRKIQDRAKRHIKESLEAVRQHKSLQEWVRRVKLLGRLS